MTFMDTIYAIRQRLGWTQQQMADALGVSRRTVIFWESGQREPVHAELVTHRLRALEAEHRNASRGRRK